MNYKFSLLDLGSGRSRAHWILKPPVIVGRCPSCDIMINDPSISRRHCQFSLDPDGALVVRDLGSKNGVYVEEKRVQRAIVRPGVIVQLGAVSLRPEWTEEAALERDQEVVQVIDVDETQPMRVVDLDQLFGKRPSD